GPALCEEPRRAVALLKDLCPGYRREVALLAHALEDRVPADLLAHAERVPLASLVATLGSRLHEHQGTDQRLAGWAVETWAAALGLLAVSAAVPPEARAAGSLVVAARGGTHGSLAAALCDVPDGGRVLVQRGRYVEA